MELVVAVFGAGIAGKVRIRDVGAKSEQDLPGISWKLAGFVSRRTLEIEGVEQLKEEDVLSSSEINAVIICTENSTHEALVRKALEAGKHVLVEFPVSLTAAGAKDLYQLAKDKGLVLHEEDIAMLTDNYSVLRDKVQKASSKIVKTEVSFTGTYNGWIETVEKSGGPFCANITLLHTLYDILGKDIKATAAEIEKTDTEFTATANLSCAKCSDITVTITRTKARSPRTKVIKFQLEDGTAIEDEPPKPTKPGTSTKPGLFMQDFLMFAQEVKAAAIPDKDMQRSTDCLELANQIHSFMGLTE